MANDSNGSFFDVSNSDIENIFQKISLSLGIVTKTAIIGFNDGEKRGVIAAQGKQLQLGIRKNNYLVMFTIDGSGSMSGSKW